MLTLDDIGRDILSGGPEITDTHLQRQTLRVAKQHAAQLCKRVSVQDSWYVFQVLTSDSDMTLLTRPQVQLVSLAAMTPQAQVRLRGKEPILRFTSPSKANGGHLRAIAEGVVQELKAELKTPLADVLVTWVSRTPTLISCPAADTWVRCLIPTKEISFHSRRPRQSWTVICTSPVGTTPWVRQLRI